MSYSVFQPCLYTFWKIKQLQEQFFWKHYSFPTTHSKGMTLNWILLNRMRKAVLQKGTDNWVVKYKCHSCPPPEPFYHTEERSQAWKYVVVEKLAFVSPILFLNAQRCPDVSRKAWINKPCNEGSKQKCVSFLTGTGFHFLSGHSFKRCLDHRSPI